MIDFEDKIMQLGKIDSLHTDPDNFLLAFHAYRKNREYSYSRMRSGIFASIFILIIGIMATTQLSNQSENMILMSQDSMGSNLFNTDLWNLETNLSSEEQLAYIDEITLFLLEEDNSWETMDLINDIYTEKNTNKEETL